MRRICGTLLALVLLSAGAGSLWAQSGPGLGTVITPMEPEREVGLPTMAPDESPAPVAPPAASPAPARPAAAAAQTQPSSGGSWVAECLEGTQSQPTCQAIVRSTNGEQTVVVLSVARSEPGEAAMQMALPLGFAVARGVDVQISGYSAVLQVSRCTAQGCLVEGTVADEMMEAIRSNSAGTLTVHTVDGDPVVLPLPGEGAAEALQAAGLGAAASQ